MWQWLCTFAVVRIMPVALTNVGAKTYFSQLSSDGPSPPFGDSNALFTCSLWLDLLLLLYFCIFLDPRGPFRVSKCHLKRRS